MVLVIHIHLEKLLQEVVFQVKGLLHAKVQIEHNVDQRFFVRHLETLREQIPNFLEKAFTFHH